MYVPKRKYEVDEDPRLPIPQQVISNGEYLPLPQTKEQKQVEALTNELADARARKLGMSRRDFLRTSAGMATVMFAMNQVYGCGGDGGGGGVPSPGETPRPAATPSPTEVPFNVCEEDTLDPERAGEFFDSDFFIMDVQTHHVDTEGLWYQTARDQIANLRFQDLGACDRLDADCKISLINRENFIREMFVESQTTVAVMSGIPPGVAGLLPNDTMAETRDEVNAATGSERMLSQMLIEPTLGPEQNAARTTIWDIERNVKELGARAIKCYPGSDLWFLDDEEIAYPMFEEASRNGIEVIAVHKGFPGLFGAQAAYRVQSIDIPKAARDWPNLNFVIYHSGYYPFPVELEDGTVVPQGVEQFAQVMEENPDLTNVYAEIGSTFAIASTAGQTGMDTIGRLLKAVGPDRMCWGTDSIWWGSPQWQICAFKAFQISERLQEEKGYPALDDEARAKIFGLNSARLYGVDPQEARTAFAADRLALARERAKGEGLIAAARPRGPRTRREFLQLSALEDHFDRLRQG